MVDVAALAGVALKTVSRVVNGEPGVSPELETRVKRAIEQLNYRRDANAATLRRLGRKTETIGNVSLSARSGSAASTASSLYLRATITPICTRSVARGRRSSSSTGPLAIS